MDKTSPVTSFFPQAPFFNFWSNLSSLLNVFKYLAEPPCSGLTHRSPNMGTNRYFSKKKAATKFANKLAFKPFKDIGTDRLRVVDLYIVILIFFFLLLFHILSSFLLQSWFLFTKIQKGRYMVFEPPTKAHVSFLQILIPMATLVSLLDTLFLHVYQQ
jgi:hypothetical protein